MPPAMQTPPPLHVDVITRSPFVAAVQKIKAKQEVEAKAKAVKDETVKASQERISKEVAFDYKWK